MAIATQNHNTTPRLPVTTSAETPDPSAAAAAAAAARQACSACKHQRRRCGPHCLLAPYFPSDKQQEFHNVHKLFGVNNVVKSLKKLAQHDRDDAMKSVIYEANMRAINPVGGCCTVIHHLQKQINLCMSELDAVRRHLDSYRARSLANFNVYDQIQDNNQENIGIKMVEQSSKNEETGKIQMVQQYLND